MPRLKRVYGVVWWLWYAFDDSDPEFAHEFRIDPESDDLAHLGEGGWVFGSDNLNLGLRTV